MTFDEAVACALALPGAALSTSYRRPAVRAAHGCTFLHAGRDADASFVLTLDHALCDMLMDTHPRTFWKTPHYDGYPSVLVRTDSPDDDVVREMIARAAGIAAAKARPRTRTRTT